jgi:hypothetical protein
MGHATCFLAAKQNDKIPPGNIYRGGRVSFSNSTLNEVFHLQAAPLPSSVLS